jgi:hypothetical protein
MRVNFKGYGKGFEIDVQKTSPIKDIRAVVRYYLGCTCDIALIYQGRPLRNGPELRDYGVLDGSTLCVELRYLSSSHHDEARDAFYGSMCQQACFVLD